jgi:hypothetical protein
MFFASRAALSLFSHTREVAAVAVAGWRWAAVRTHCRSLCAPYHSTHCRPPRVRSLSLPRHGLASRWFGNTADHLGEERFITERCQILNAPLLNMLQVCLDFALFPPHGLTDLSSCQNLLSDYEEWKRALASSSLSPGDRSALGTKVEKNREIIAAFYSFQKVVDSLKGSSFLFLQFLSLSLTHGFSHPAQN